jgi:D-alanyl-lipoteichoic acid acyltransferase DltB (MBOAT superfamily)
MAIGLALLFNLRLPENFDSPYQATSLIDFWRRWHMTLARFLRDYVYIPLGGNRHGAPRQYTNLMITLTLGGLWHGAAWTFVVFGVLHGAGVVVNHAWNGARRPLPAPLAWTLLMLFICTTFVIFRAVSFERVEVMWAGMVGWHGLSLERAAHTIGGNRWKWLAFGAGIVLLCPNRQTIMAWPWRSNLVYAATFALIAAIGVLSMGNPTPFIYFQF